MLTNIYLRAEKLEIDEWIRDGLVDLLGRMERGEVKHVPINSYVSTGLMKTYTGRINMAVWSLTDRCGSVGCLGGNVELLTGRKMPPWIADQTDDDEISPAQQELVELFYPETHDGSHDSINYERITLNQIIEATRNYLTIGSARWPEVLGLKERAD